LPWIELAADPLTVTFPPRITLPVPVVCSVAPARLNAPTYDWLPFAVETVTAPTSIVSAAIDRALEPPSEIPALTFTSSVPEPPAIANAPGAPPLLVPKLLTSTISFPVSPALIVSVPVGLVKLTDSPEGGKVEVTRVFAVSPPSCWTVIVSSVVL